jgi:hypothetical protein
LNARRASAPRAYRGAGRAPSVGSGGDLGLATATTYEKHCLADERITPWHRVARSKRAVFREPRVHASGPCHAYGKSTNVKGIPPSPVFLGTRWALVVASGLLGLLGCSGAVLGDGSNTADGGTQGANPLLEVADGGPATSGCEHYYAAQNLRCGGPVLPSSEAMRDEARFVRVCLNDMALPGSGMTHASVEACAAALDSSPCDLPDGPPVACKFNGALPGGAPCNEGLQCQSGQCQGTAALTPEGPIGPYTCGTCAPFVTVGQVCSGGCASNAICLIGAGMETAADPTYSCIAVTQGDVGAACDDLSAICKTGLYCAAQTGRCTALADAGAVCGEGATPPGDPGGCVAPLGCVGLQGDATCGSGAAAAFCLDDNDCSPGLGCAPGPCSSSIARIGCSASGTCQPVTWAMSGQACDGYRTRCLVGSCGSGSGIGPPLIPPADGGAATGTCPMIASDGQPCNSECDTFAECFSPTGKAGASGLVGTCTLLDSVVCK